MAKKNMIIMVKKNDYHGKKDFNWIYTYIVSFFLDCETLLVNTTEIILAKFS